MHVNTVRLLVDYYRQPASVNSCSNAPIECLILIVRPCAIRPGEGRAAFESTPGKTLGFQTLVRRLPNTRLIRSSPRPWQPRANRDVLFVFFHAFWPEWDPRNCRRTAQRIQIAENNYWEQNDRTSPSCGAREGAAQQTDKGDSTHERRHHVLVTDSADLCQRLAIDESNNSRDQHCIE